jgi:tRNA(Ile)-lysidine synthase
MTLESSVLKQILRDKLAPFSDAHRFIVGFSGGMDSHALLHALVSLELPQSILALHVNHGISPNAKAWEAHCEAVCNALGVHFCAETVNVIRDGSGLENAARQARYDLFARHIGYGDLLLLAHHADDQLETFFLRLLRGAGVRGLGGMPDWRTIGDGSLQRPWLACQQADLCAYAQAHELKWIEDESNADLQFDRNFLREEVLPQLHRRWPQAGASIARSMSWCGEADAVGDELAEIDYFACYPHPERLGWSLALGYLCGLSRARRRNVLRLWLTRCGVTVPGHRILDAIQDQSIEARTDASPQIAWGQWQCRRYQGRLYVMPRLPAIDTERVWQCGVGDVIHDACFGELSFAAAQGQGMRLETDRPLTIMFSREGVRCRPVGRNHSQTLKKLFQAAAIPPWLRERTPLVYQDDQLLAVGDWWVCADAAVMDEEAGYLLQWELS